MQELGTKFLRSLVELFPWFASFNAYALIPLPIPALITGASAAAHGFKAHPRTLGDVAKRIANALALFATLFLALLCLWLILLINSPPGGSFLTFAIPALIVFPLVACWLFGLVWRLGYDLGTLSAHIHAARWKSGHRAR
jgi:hypothetical protein